MKNKTYLGWLLTNGKITLIIYAIFGIFIWNYLDTVKEIYEQNSLGVVIGIGIFLIAVPLSLALVSIAKDGEYSNRDKE